VEIQAASANGVHTLASGFAKIEFLMADAEGPPVT
jgi:hypothetical protein